MNRKKITNYILDNLKTILGALIIAIIIRSFIFQPFYIPSSSMEPTLLIGDRIFVSKYTYGFSKHSFPFSPKIFKERILYKKPKQGDLVVFKTPADNRTDYIKRLIGKPGDTIQFISGNLYLNGNEIIKTAINKNDTIYCGNNKINTITFEEKLPGGKKYIATYYKDYSLQNTDKFIVPDEHFFFLGDNRDCSKDSRFLSEVGYVKRINLVGKAKMIFFSNDTIKSSFLKFWNWNQSLRLKRTFLKL